MKSVYIFPTLLIFLDICAAIVCAVNSDIRKTIYWIAAAVLTVTVTF